MFVQGSITALATPFTASGIDEPVFAAFVEWQIQQGTKGLVVCGTTGEGPTLTSRRTPAFDADLRRTRRAMRARSSSARVRTAPPRRSSRHAPRRRMVPTPHSSSRLITTNRPRRVSIGIMRRSRMRSTCPCCFTTSRRGPVSTSTSRPSGSSRRFPRSSASRTRPATSIAPARPRSRRAAASSSCRATTEAPFRSTSPAAGAASRWWRTSRRRSAQRCNRRVA